MKRIRLLILLGVVAVALPMSVLYGGVAGAQAASASVSIEPKAQYDVHGEIIHVEVVTTCTGGAGAVIVEVTQQAPDTFAPTFGSGPNTVVCDGRAHETGVTIHAALLLPYDAGKALAHATLTVVDPTTLNELAQAEDERVIDIRVV